MNVSKNSMNMFSIFSQRFGQGSMLKSTREKLQRQEKAQSQIDYWENQKENLKEMECDTAEEIVKKLEKFHSYEDEIAAVKQSYNFEQMHHILDEAQEQGEKIAEAAKKTEPKTEEERKKEAIEEATGAEETGGILEDMLDEMLETVEEMAEKLTEEVTEELTEGVTEELTEQVAEGPIEEPVPEAAKCSSSEAMKGLPAKAEQMTEKSAQELYEEAVEEQQIYRELAERYAGTASDIEARKGVQFDYRM